MPTHLIIGANRGIGLALATQLHGRGDRVVAVSRTPMAEPPTPGETDFARVIHSIDVTDDNAVRALAAQLTDEPLDTVWVVAGVLAGSSLSAPDFPTCQRLFEINALGPLRVVTALRDQLQPGAKIGLLTSRMGSMGDNSSGGSYAYRMSKAALNAAGVSMAVDLKPAGVAVALLHPGWVRTEMTGGRGLIDAAESAAGLIARMDALTLAESGGFWHANGERLVW